MSERELTLEELIRREVEGGKRLLDAVNEVFKGVSEGRIKLVDPDPPQDYLTYLRRPEYSGWLWTTVTLLALTALTIVTSGASQAILYLRYVLGSITVLFIPGYVTIELLYPREEDLSPLERLALSIGLSLALVPLIGLVLNYTPWGIRLAPIAASLTIYATVAAFAAGYRKYALIVRSHGVKAPQLLKGGTQRK